MAKPVKKIEDSGSRKILVTERGYTMGYNDLVVDPRAFHHFRQIGYPVVFDIGHSVRRYGIPSSDPRVGCASSCRCWPARRWRPGSTGSSSRPTRIRPGPTATPPASTRSTSSRPS